MGAKLGQPYTYTGQTRARPTPSMQTMQEIIAELSKVVLLAHTTEPNDEEGLNKILDDMANIQLAIVDLKCGPPPTQHPSLNKPLTYSGETLPWKKWRNTSA